MELSVEHTIITLLAMVSVCCRMTGKCNKIHNNFVYSSDRVGCKSIAYSVRIGSTTADAKRKTRHLYWIRLPIILHKYYPVVVFFDPIFAKNVCNFVRPARPLDTTLMCLICICSSCCSIGVAVHIPHAPYTIRNAC